MPQSPECSGPRPPEILVSVDDQGRFFLDAEPVDPDRLEALLRPRLERSKERVVTFRGDRKTPYQWFVKALDAARAAGADQVEIMHEGER